MILSRIACADRPQPSAKPVMKGSVRWTIATHLLGAGDAPMLGYSPLEPIPPGRIGGGGYSVLSDDMLKKNHSSLRTGLAVLSSSSSSSFPSQASSFCLVEPTILFLLFLRSHSFLRIHILFCGRAAFIPYLTLLTHIPFSPPRRIFKLPKQVTKYT